MDPLKREAEVVTTNELVSELLDPKPPLKTEAEESSALPARTPYSSEIGEDACSGSSGRPHRPGRISVASCVGSVGKYRIAGKRGPRPRLPYTTRSSRGASSDPHPSLILRDEIMYTNPHVIGSKANALQFLHICEKLRRWNRPAPAPRSNRGLQWNRCMSRSGRYGRPGVSRCGSLPSRPAPLLPPCGPVRRLGGTSTGRGPRPFDQTDLLHHLLGESLHDSLRL